LESVSAAVRPAKIGLTEESQSDFSQNLVIALQGPRNAVQTIEGMSWRRRTLRDGQEHENFGGAALNFQAEPAAGQFDEWSDDSSVAEDYTSVAESQPLAERRRLDQAEFRAPHRRRELWSGNTGPRKPMRELHVSFADHRAQWQGPQPCPDLIVVVPDEPGCFMYCVGATVRI
jgi:hypothetical protein